MTKSENDSPAAEQDEAGDEVIGLALRGSLLVIGVASLVCLGVWLWLRRPPPVVPNETPPLAIPAKRTVPEASIPQMPFTDVTQAAGIDFVHENGAAGEKLLPETMGSGCAVLDYDSDGDQDLLFVNSMRWPWDARPNPPAATPALYQNDGRGHFKNVTAGSGLDRPLYGMGVAVADYDGDGDTDIFLTAVGRSLLYRNEGGVFREVGKEAGVAGTESDWGTSCGFFDYDNDGDLDLFVCRYLAWTREYDLAQEFKLVGLGRAYGRPQLFEGTFPCLFRNDGNGSFRDVSASCGLQVTNPSTNVPAAKALGVAFADFDIDGWVDVVVANDTVPNFLFHNRQGVFEEIGSTAGLAYDVNGLARGAMGIDIAHFRNDEDCGILIGNFANEMTALYVAQGNHLQFRDDAVSNGLGPKTRLELTFGLFFFDADLDGRQDLFATNGHLENEIHRVQKSQSYAQPPHFFWNAGPRAVEEFVPVTDRHCGAALLSPVVGRGAAYADFDGDGDLDLVVTASGGPARLFRNDQSLNHHWLRVVLRGRSPNRDAIGAQVELTAGNQTQRRFVSPTRSYLSQCELPLTFGLGSAQKIDRLTVRWPSGRISTLSGISPNQVLSVDE